MSVEEETRIKRYEPAAGALERHRPLPPAAFDTVEMEPAPDLLAYWRVVRKRRWTILTIFFVLFTVVLLGTLKQKPMYRARALLEIEKENPNILSVQELFELETVSDTYLETQYKILKSNTLARRVIELTGSQSKIVYLAYDEAYEEGFEDMARRLPDTTKARRAVGFTATMTLKDILLSVIEYYRKVPALTSQP